MRWPIQHQVFVPSAVLLAIAVATTAVTSSWLSARRSGADELQQLARVVDALQAVNFPYTASVLERMRGLSGAEFVLVDPAGRNLAATLPGEIVLPPLDDAPALLKSTTSLSAFPAAEVAGQMYFVAGVETPSAGERRQLYILYPQAAWRQRRWDAAWPPLAIGGLTLALMLLVSGWFANRIGRRMATVRSLFSELQAGRFPRLPPSSVQDELATLIDAANELSSRLEELQGEVTRTERLRILAQLAGGFAHQLRNALTGARLAVQWHQRKCPGDGADDSLSVALAQLRLTEQQVQGLLALSREQAGAPQPGDLSQVLAEVAQLVGPNVEHRHVAFTCRDELTGACRIVNRDALRAALLNLVLNAIEAAGIGGHVALSACDADAPAEAPDEAGAPRPAAGPAGSMVRISVEDDGAGPPEVIRERLFEPFVTSKSEGVGLGLALAQQAAQELGGALRWTRDDSRTVFCIEFPRPAEPANDPAAPGLRMTGTTTTIPAGSAPASV